MTGDRFLGAVLAGGESRRFGRDKAAEVVAGTSLVERAGTLLGEAFDQVVIVSSREPVTSRWLHVHDLRAGQGPLAGIEAALLHAQERGLDGTFVLACDLPLVDADTVARVLEVGSGAGACAPSRGGHPGFEPLCAVYSTSCLPAITQALDQGRRAVHEVFAAVGGVRTSVRRDVFLNVNRPRDVQRAAELLASRHTHSAAPPARRVP